MLLSRWTRRYVSGKMMNIIMEYRILSTKLCDSQVLCPLCYLPIWFACERLQSSTSVSISSILLTTGRPMTPYAQLERHKLASSAFVVPNEILFLVFDLLDFEDRSACAHVCSQWRPLALSQCRKLKVSQIASFSQSRTTTLISKRRIGNPWDTTARFVTTVSRVSDGLVYFSLYGCTVLSQDILRWIFTLRLRHLETFKVPSGLNAENVDFIRGLVHGPTWHWPKLSSLSLGFGSKVDIPSEGYDLMQRFIEQRPGMKTNLAKCSECTRLYFTCSRVKCAACLRSICSQHFSRVGGRQCRNSLRFKCGKYH